MFYLKRWAGADGLLERYTKPIPAKLDIKRVGPNAIGWSENLYRSPETDEAKTQLLEQLFFRQLDNDAARVLHKLNLPVVPELSGRELSIWSTFIMSLWHRTPENLAATKEAGERLWPQITTELKDRFDELRGEGDPETYEQYVASLDPLDPERATLRNLPQTICNRNIGTFLNSLQWRTFDLSGGDRTFLISDDPIARTNGLKKAGGHLAMPVTG